MKRSMFVLALALVLLFALALTGCDKECDHDWKKATCESAKTCEKCGETKGEALGHSWKAATCTSPKTCETCGVTQDVALGHSWKDATCQDPKTCTTCGTTEGEVGGHTWVEANCMAAKTCSTCKLTEGGLGDHEIQEATCEAPQTCAHCGLTVGEPLGHDWTEGDCETPKTCTRCDLVEGVAPGHVWYGASCEEPKHCDVCGKTEGEALGHIWKDATCVAPKMCETCYKTEGKALGHDWQDATTSTPKTCATCGATEGKPIQTDSRFQTDKCKALFGTWKSETVISGADLGLESFTDTITEVSYLTFNNDGTVDIVVVVEDKEAYVDFMTAFMYAMFQEMGMSKTQADQAIMAEYGMTVREYAAYACEAEGNTAMEMVYYVSNDELYMGESWHDELTPAEMVIKGNKLTLYDPDLDETLVLTRV